MTEQPKIHHVGLIARNYDETVKWYTTHLGFAVTEEWSIPDRHPGVRMSMLTHGDFVVEVIADGPKLGHHVARDLMEDYKITGFRYLAFEVDDVDSEMARLESEGVSALLPPTTIEAAGVRVAFVRDPEGNTIELMKQL